MARLTATRVPVTLEQTKTRQGNAIQTNAAKTAAAVNRLPRQGQVTIYGQTFAVGTNTVVIHGLGRPLVGWTLVRPRNWAAGAGTITQCTEIASDDMTLTLGPFAGFTADVEVW